MPFVSAVCLPLLLLLVQLPPVLEFNINMPPLPNASGSLVFVCLRLCTYPKNKNCDLPKTLAAKFEEVFATSAQQFKGYLFKAHENAFKEVCCNGSLKEAGVASGMTLHAEHGVAVLQGRRPDAATIPQS